MFTKGELRPSKLGVGDGGALPIVEDTSVLDSTGGGDFSISSALCTK